MARQARKMEPFGIYHIYQSSQEDTLLFMNDKDRAYFMETVIRAKQRFGFKLFAYCLKHPKMYHLVLHANGSDLSKVMKSINISYAMYVKNQERHQEKLFKDRYKSEKIETENQFNNIMNGLKDPNACFNSFCQFGDYGEEVDTPVIETKTETGDKMYCCFDGECFECIKTEEEAYAKLKALAQEKQMTVKMLLKDKTIRNQLILMMRQSSTLSLKSIGEVFGGLSESTVCKILKGKCQ